MPPLEEQYARDELQKLATARRTYGCGTEVLRSFRRGSIDYSRIPELRGIDLEPYRKKPVEVVKINLSPVQSRRCHALTAPSRHMNEYFGFRNLRQFEQKHREVRLPCDLLNDERFRRLADARKAHLICLLLLAARMGNLLPEPAGKARNVDRRHRANRHRGVRRLYSIFNSSQMKLKEESNEDR